MHPARLLNYFHLVDGLSKAVEDGWVSESRSESGLCLYTYTRATVHERHWTEITELARGLIIDHKNRHVVATPFPKFFNVGERQDQKIPDLSFETFEKVDGSLIILYWHDGEWHTATKGSFISEQAADAAEWLRRHCDLKTLIPAYTFLLEWVGPQNRIVIRYDKPELVMLGAYDHIGSELSYDELLCHSSSLGLRTAKRHGFNHISDLIVHAQTLPATEEGFVIRFDNGLRLKVKGDEYRRIHAMISRCTPLAMWEALKAGDDMEKIRRDLPEEFWGDFDVIVMLLRRNLDRIIIDTKYNVEKTRHWSDKEVGLSLETHYPAHIRSFIFPMRKNGTLTEGRTREALFRAIRPTANKLDGYTPSSGIKRVLDES